MDELSQRDLSAVPDEDLSPEERRELKRRLAEFVDRLRQSVATAAKPEPKRSLRRDPGVLFRRENRGQYTIFGKTRDSMLFFKSFLTRSRARRREAPPKTGQASPWGKAQAANPPSEEK